MMKEEKYLRRLAKGGTVVFCGTVLGGLVGILLHMLLSRTLGARQYGLYMLGFSVFLVAHSILSLGLQKGILRYVSIHFGMNDLERTKGTLLFSLAVGPTMNIFGGALIYIFADKIATGIFGESEFATVIRLFAIALPFYDILMLCCSGIRGFQKMFAFTLFRNILQPIVNITIVIVLFLLTELNLRMVLYAYLVTILILVIVAVSYLRYIFPDLISNLQPIIESQRMMRYSIPLLFVGMAYILLSSIDRIMIGYYCVSEDVGIYSVAAKLAIQIKVVLTCINATIGPIIADLSNKGRTDEIALLFKTSTRWIVTLILPMVLICVLFAKNLVGLFGTDFSESSLILVILACAYLIAAGTGSVGVILNMTGKQDIEMVNTFCMLLLNIALNVWLIQVYGVVGAAIAAGLSIGLINIVKLIEVKILFGFQPYDRKYIKPIFVAGGIFVPSFLCFNRISLGGTLWLFWGTAIIFVYIGALFLLGIEQEDKSILEAMKKKLYIKGF